jgi:hypothetical protein
VFVDHQLTVTPFIGRSFNKSIVYLGVGASLSHVGARLNDVVGFGDIPEDGLGLVDISGQPQSVADSQPAFGVAATAGITYFTSPTCFLDINYTFSNPFPDTFHAECHSGTKRTARLFSWAR